MPPSLHVLAPPHVRMSTLFWSREGDRRCTLALDVRVRFPSPDGVGVFDDAAWAPTALLRATVPYRARCDVLATGWGLRGTPVTVQVVRAGAVILAAVDSGFTSVAPAIVEGTDDGSGFLVLPADAPSTYQAVPPSQQLDGITGGECFVLEGRMLQLPGLAVVARLDDAIDVTLRVDTIAFDLRSMRAVLTFRGVFPVKSWGHHAVRVEARPLGSRGRVAFATLPLADLEGTMPHAHAGDASGADLGAPFPIARSFDGAQIEFSRSATPFGDATLASPPEPGGGAGEVTLDLASTRAEAARPSSAVGAAHRDTLLSEIAPAEVVGEALLRKLRRAGAKPEHLDALRKAFAEETK